MATVGLRGPFFPIGPAERLTEISSPRDIIRHGGIVLNASRRKPVPRVIIPCRARYSPFSSTRIIALDRPSNWRLIIVMHTFRCQTTIDAAILSGSRRPRSALEERLPPIEADFGGKADRVFPWTNGTEWNSGKISFFFYSFLYLDRRLIVKTSTDRKINCWSLVCFILFHLIPNFSLSFSEIMETDSTLSREKIIFPMEKWFFNSFLIEREFSEFWLSKVYSNVCLISRIYFNFANWFQFAILFAHKFAKTWKNVKLTCAEWNEHREMNKLRRNHVGAGNRRKGTLA